MAYRKKLVVLLFTLAAAVFAAALFVLCAGGISAQAAVYKVETDSVTFERLTSENPKTATLLNNSYLEIYSVPTSKLSYENNGGEQSGAPLSYAFDRNFGSIWRSALTWKAGDETTINSVTVTFQTPAEIDRILYQADCSWYNRGSFTKARISYLPADAGSGAAYSVISELTVEQTSDTSANLITFRSAVKARAVKLEWLAVHTGHLHCAAASEIVFLQPESNAVKEVQALFSDYNQLHLANSNLKKADLDSLRDRVKGYASYETELSYLLNRAEQVLAGTVQYDARREMATAPGSENVLERRGDVAGYARSTLKMAWFGTNRQATGVSVAPGEELIVYVNGKPGDPLPNLVVTQFWGAWSSWKSGEYKLSLGKNIIRPGSYLQPGFTTNDGMPLPAGGPIYLTNPYISEQLRKETPTRTEKVQSDAVKVYFEGGTLIPIFRKGGDEGLYQQRVAEYAKAVEKDRAETDAQNADYTLAPRDYKVVDVTEIVSDNIMITVRATSANRYFNELQYHPQETCTNWDDYIKALLRSDGVILEKDDPSAELLRGKYDPRAQWLNCNIRLMQPFGAAYAYTEHVGIQVSWEGGALTGLSFGWGYTHELGHMMDIGERTVSECSNNMLSKYDETVLTRVATRGDFAKTTAALSPDVREEPSYWNTNRGNFIFWWLLESFSNSWWPRLENLYRYYDIYHAHRNADGSLEKDFATINATEKQVLLSSISMGYDLSYYFERWGYNLSANDPVFSVKTASPSFLQLMEEAVKRGEFKREGYEPKIWYLDAAEWWARHEDKEVPTEIYGGKGKAWIEAVTKGSTGYSLLLRSEKMNDASHLGFEIWEGTGKDAKVIAFTSDSVFLDSTVYGKDYLPVYSVVAYDRALTSSARSAEVALKELAPVCRIGNTQYTSLYDAFEAAKSGDTVVLLADCYMGGMTVESGKTLTIATDGKPHTLSRGGAGVMFTVEQGAKLILQGQSGAELTVDGLGYEQDSSLVRTLGNLEISHCVLRNNHIRYNAKKGGGAIDAVPEGENVAVTLKDSRFENNSAYYGGAICCTRQGVVIEGCTFRENHAVEGGAVYVGNVAVTFKKCNFESNVADMGGLNNVTPVGGGMAVVNWYAKIYAEDLTFTNNAAARGGALYFDSDLFDGKRITMKGNRASEEGGAVYLARKGWTNNMNWNDLSLVDTTIEGTECEAGAALYLRSNSTLGLTLKENAACREVINFAEGNFTLQGGAWQGKIFLSKIAALTAKTAFPTGKDVYVQTDREEVGGAFISANGFKGKLGDEAGFAVEGGSIAFDDTQNALVFALRTVNITFEAGEKTVSNKYIVGRTFTLPLAFENDTKYMLSWSDGTNTYEPGTVCVAQADTVFTADVKDKAVVTYAYPREDLEEEKLYIIPGEVISLPKLDEARNPAFRKYDLKGWTLKGSNTSYLPFASVEVTGDMTFEAELTDKLVVNYYIRPYASESAATYAVAASEDHLIATYYYTYGEPIVFVRWKDAPKDYVPENGTIDGYRNAATGEEIDFSKLTVTSNLDLYAIVTEQPITIFYTYMTNGGQKVYDGVTTPMDLVRPGDDYTISIANIPYGYHITQIQLATEDGTIAEFTSREEIEGFRIENASAWFYGILVNIEPNEYTVTYKYNDSAEDVRTQTMTYGSVLTLHEPQNLPAGYHFNSYQIGRKTLAINEEGLYTEQDDFVNVNFDEEGKIEVEITEDIVINIVTAIDPALTLSASQLTFLLGVTEPVTLTASTVDDSFYTLLWESSDPAVATVSEGRVIALAAGSAKIVVYACRGADRLTSAECLVTVTSAQDPSGGEQDPSEQNPSGGEQNPSSGEQNPSEQNPSDGEQNPSGGEQDPSEQNPSGGEQNPSEQNPSEQKPSGGGKLEVESKGCFSSALGYGSFAFAAVLLVALAAALFLRRKN